MKDQEFIGINWGSTNFAAHLISPRSGLIDTYRAAKGITKLDRDGMVSTLSDLAARWPGNRRIYASGMIGSNLGWTEAPYLKCPASLADFALSIVPAKMGAIDCNIVPGLRSILPNGDPDVLRGEEIEIFGLLHAGIGSDHGECHLVLPGTHTKWVRVSSGRVVEFFTSMGGDLFDSLSGRSLLSSMLVNESAVDQAFLRGVRRAFEEAAGLPRLLFGVRAQVVTGSLSKSDAPAYTRGLIIGTELSDALRLYPTLARQAAIPLLGNSALCGLYAKALATLGIRAEVAEPLLPLVRGYTALHAAATGRQT